ncbi:unnamed protein product [Ranitomeya imitator]|uniref:Uncharacterized protein n=1 Tax=Ranitomeya imitator TaxID=111125 RepID=A0ABN9KWR5_9NEOB|nr:unnamed protein product [Ranitomeya imitator]
MKNIAIFLLVGLGLFSSGYSIDVNDVAGLGIDINDCLNALFQKGPELLTSLAGIACKKPDQRDFWQIKINCLVDRNLKTSKRGRPCVNVVLPIVNLNAINYKSDIEKVKKSVQATTDFLIKANCLPGDLVGLDVQNVADDVLDEVNKMYLSIVSDHLEPLKVVMPTVCTLLSPALTSNCVHELLQEAALLDRLGAHNRFSSLIWETQSCYANHTLTVGHLTDKLGIKLLSVLNVRGDLHIMSLFCRISYLKIMNKTSNNTDPNSINLETVKKVWSKLECGLGQALDIKGLELVTGPAKSVVNNVVSKTVNEILNNKQLESVMTGVNCLVIKKNLDIFWYLQTCNGLENHNGSVCHM